MKIGIIKEYKSPPDKRVVFSPEKCVETLQKFPQVEFFIEKSDIRCFSDSEYEEMGLKVVTDLSNCDVLIGVKEVPIEKLIDNKKYFFFSHTIKKQPYNKKFPNYLLQMNLQQVQLLGLKTLFHEKSLLYLPKLLKSLRQFP